MLVEVLAIVKMMLMTSGDACHASGDADDRKAGGDGHTADAAAGDAES